MGTILQSLDDARSAALDGTCAKSSDWVRVTENIDAAFERLRTTVLRVEAEALPEVPPYAVYTAIQGVVGCEKVMAVWKAIRAAIPQSGKGD